MVLKSSREPLKLGLPEEKQAFVLLTSAIFCSLSSLTPKCSPLTWIGTVKENTAINIWLHTCCFENCCQFCKAPSSCYVKRRCAIVCSAVHICITLSIEREEEKCYSSIQYCCIETCLHKPCYSASSTIPCLFAQKFQPLSEKNESESDYNCQHTRTDSGCALLYYSRRHAVWTQIGQVDKTQKPLCIP